MKTFFITLLWGFLLIFFSGCAGSVSTLETAKREELTKLPGQRAPLLRYFDKTDKELAGKSAFYPLEMPTDALAARLFLIDHATTSLDVQYYIYDDDLVGHIFTAHLLKAAQRGVKVRMLIDDLTSSGKDEEIEKLILHPNIKLRLFNPNRFRTAFRNMALLFSVDSLGKRMHNKALIADGAAAIVGGRNIGEVYFDSDSETLFLDYDILAVGKVVPDIYKAFDLYWNSREAVSAEEIIDAEKSTPSKALIRQLDEELEQFDHSRLGTRVRNSHFNKEANSRSLALIVADSADFFYDYPDKVRRDADDSSTHISSQINENLLRARKSLLVISPYFVPSDKMMHDFNVLRRDGVEISVITNSLASTDVFPVYAGYKESIKDLLDMGVELYELKPQSLKEKLRGHRHKKVPILSLHTKIMIFDRQRLGIGSANIDPRSIKLNTEYFMIIDSKSLAREHGASLKQIVNLENFYKLSWGAYPKMYGESDVDHGPIWTTIENGKEKRYYTPPSAPLWKKLGTDFISLFPIKGYL